jgi:hypothetical protein
LLGGFYRAQGETPRPTIILLHGIPGVEKNLDLASALRDAGCNVLYFHYRGCWGSAGRYSITGQPEDVHAATAWVLGQPCVDGNRLALIGYSLGGYMALSTGAADERFRALVALCPLVDPARDAVASSIFDDFATMLSEVTGAELEAQWHALRPITQMTAQLARRGDRAVADRETPRVSPLAPSGCNLLLVTGDRDELFPPEHHAPLAHALPHMQWLRFAEGDHSLSLCRRPMIEAVVNWLGINL